MEKTQILCRISGRSLESQGIFNRDFVIADKTLLLKNDDLVLLKQEDNSFLVKRFFKKRNHLYFYPFDPKISSRKNAVKIDTAKLIGKITAIICLHRRKHNQKI